MECKQFPQAKELRDDLDDMTVQRDNLQKANDFLLIDNEDLKTSATIDADAAQEYENACEDLEKEVSQQKKELREARNETADLRAQLTAVSCVSWE